MAERAALPGPPVLPAHERESLAAAAAALAAGGIVGLPTETVYGVGVVPRPEALKALVAAKRRPEEKGIALLVDDLAQVEDLVLVGAVARRLAARFWPGPLTLVLPLRRADLVPAALSGGRDTLAVRLPDHAVPRALARELGPLAVSSANLSGRARCAHRGGARRRAGAVPGPGARRWTECAAECPPASWPWMRPAGSRSSAKAPSDAPSSRPWSPGMPDVVRAGASWAELVAERHRPARVHWRTRRGRAAEQA